MRNERTLAYLLIGLGVFSLLARNGGADWLWLALLGVVFLFGYVSRKTYGFLIAGSVLLGIAVGSLIDSQGGMLLSLAAGFYAIDQVERRPNRWPYYTAGILAVLGVLSALGSLGILTSVGFALLLVAGGAYLLYREREKGRSTADVEAMYPSPTPAPAPATSEESQSAPTADTTPNPATANTVDATAPVFAPPPLEAPAADMEIPVAETSGMETNATETKGGATTVTETKVAETEASEPTVAQPSRPVTDPGAEARLARLEQWRRATAAEAGTPSYIVFSNDTLFRIASANPRTLEELDGIRGVGPVKLERYGSAVLNVLREAPTAP